MSIQETDIIWRKSQVMSDTPSNGGRMTSLLIPNGVKNSIFPNVSQADRTNGVTRYRKVFIHVANDADLALLNAKVFVETMTPGDDSVVLFLGTQTDTQANITGTEQVYGAGQLHADVASGATSIQVMTEGASLDYFKDGMTVRISDKPTVNSATGNTEYVTINGAPTYSGDVATITLASPLANSYAAASTRVASVIESGDVKASYTGFTVTSAGSLIYDDSTYPILLDHIATVRQDWTLSFTSSTTFDIIGDELGTVGTGNTSSTTAPVNTDYGKPYFTLDSAGFSGTAQIGDTITFTTDPASIPVWYKNVVPAGASSLSGNKVIVAIDGESE